MLANLAMRDFDKLVSETAYELGLTYTRYADDLTFSGPEAEVRRMLGLVPKVAEEEGFKINHAKTRLMRQSGRQAVTGVIVNKDMGLSRKDRRKLRAALHHQKVGKADQAEAARLKGKIAYLNMLNPAQARRLRDAHAPL